MARAAEGEVASLCDAISGDLKFGETVSKGKGALCSCFSGQDGRIIPVQVAGCHSCRTDLCCTGLLEKYLSVNKSRDVGIGGCCAEYSQGLECCGGTSSCPSSRNNCPGIWMSVCLCVWCELSAVRSLGKRVESVPLVKQISVSH